MAQSRAWLHVGSRTFLLQDRAGAGAAGRLVRFDDVLGALRWLRRASDAPGARAALRRFLVESTSTADVSWQEDDDVLRRLAHLFAAGHALVVELPSGALGVLGGGETEEASPAPASARAPAAPRTWITIELVGEDGLPIGGERYRIELPDGSVREGVLDGQGLARVQGIDPGECTVTFPALDRDAWVPIGTTGEP